MTPQELRNWNRFVTAADTHWTAAFGRLSKKDVERSAGRLLFSALDAAVGKLKPKDADHVRRMFLQALRRRAR